MVALSLDDLCFFQSQAPATWCHFCDGKIANAIKCIEMKDKEPKPGHAEMHDKSPLYV